MTHHSLEEEEDQFDEASFKSARSTLDDQVLKDDSETTKGESSNTLVNVDPNEDDDASTISSALSTHDELIDDPDNKPLLLAEESQKEHIRRVQNRLVFIVEDSPRKQLPRDKLCEAYESLYQSRVPWKKLGFKSLQKMLNSNPSLCAGKRTGDVSQMVRLVPDFLEDREAFLDFVAEELCCTKMYRHMLSILEENSDGCPLRKLQRGVKGLGHFIESFHPYVSCGEVLPEIVRRCNRITEKKIKRTTTYFLSPAQE